MQDRSFPFIPVKQRIDTVRYLLEQGLQQSEIGFVKWDEQRGILEKLMHSTYVRYTPEPVRAHCVEYCAAVLELLDSYIAKRDGVKGTWRSAKRWLKSKIST